MFLAQGGPSLALELFGAPIYVRHEVVHNKYVVDNLRAKGAVFVDELDQVPDGATVIFSAHGVAKAVQAGTLILIFRSITIYLIPLEPLATIIPLDLASLVGGAVITETVFGWNGMGRLFVDSLRNVSLNPLMGYFLVTSIMLLMGNIVADILYATLDPRIRLNA